MRAHLLTLVVATTGSASLAATKDGFTRTTGSFQDNGFSAGMELVPAGFNSTLNKPWIVENVDDLMVTIVGGLPSTASADTGRSLSVGLPRDIQWHGTQTPVTTNPATRPRLIEQWVPGAVEDTGAMVDTGLYALTWNALANKGLMTTLRQMSALRNHFPPGLTFEVDDDLLRVTGSPAPSFTQPITTDNGYESSTLRIPWRVMTTNLEVA